MANCENCIHADVCDQASRQRWALLAGETECSDFKDRAAVVELVHAEWIDGISVNRFGDIVYRSIDCSNCEEIFKTDDREYWKKIFKVCPFCGAKMDGKQEENNLDEAMRTVILFMTGKEVEDE